MKHFGKLQKKETPLKLPNYLNGKFRSKYSSTKDGLIADVNSFNIEKRTALHCAVCGGKVNAVKLLLKYGASLKASTIHCRTPLHFVCIMGGDEICQILLDAGANVNAQDFQGNTPAHYAAFYSILSFNSRIFKYIETIIKQKT